MEQIWYSELAWMAAKVMAVVIPLLIGVAYLTLAERRVIGSMQLQCTTYIIILVLTLQH